MDIFLESVDPSLDLPRNAEALRQHSLVLQTTDETMLNRRRNHAVKIYGVLLVFAFLFAFMFMFACSLAFMLSCTLAFAATLGLALGDAVTVAFAFAFVFAFSGVLQPLAKTARAKKVKRAVVCRMSNSSCVS